MTRVLIIGADGAIGRHMARRLGAIGYDVVATTRRYDTANSKRIAVDLAAPGFSAASLPGADIVLICAAMARFADCREHPDIARRVNVDAPQAVAERYSRAGGRVILLSTSAVFDCLSPRVAADRPMSPRSAYGLLKAEAETAVLRFGPSMSVLRLTKVLTPDMALVAGWIDALRRGRPVQAFSDMTISPVGLDDVEAAVMLVIGDRSGGRYQVSASDDISYADIARHLADRLDRPDELVEPIEAGTRGIPESEITRYTSLDTSRLQSLSPWRPCHGRAVVDDVFGFSPAKSRLG